MPPLAGCYLFDALPPTPALPGMSERYIPPPPPYEVSLRRDQKLAEEVQALEVSKGNPFRGEECKGAKHSKALADETLNVVTRSLSSTPTCPIRSDSAGLRAPRPLPPSPADIDIRPLAPRRQESKFRPVIEIKTYGVQDDHEREPHSPAPPPFSAIGPSLGEPSYRQSILYPSTSIYPSPSPYHSQPSYDAPRNYNDRQPISAHSSTETSFRRPSQHSKSLSYPLSQNKNFETRLSFDPSVAYPNSQAASRTAFSAQRGVPASLYSSAVSSHVHLDSAMIPVSRQSYVPARSALWNTETSHLDKTDMPSVRPHAPVSTYPSPSSPSLYIPRQMSGDGYEQRWAMSESDITKDVYHR